MNNKTKPMKAIDFQNKMEGKIAKYEEQIESARARITRAEGALERFKEAVEGVQASVSDEEKKSARTELVFWQVMISIPIAYMVIMAAYYVLGQ